MDVALRPVADEDLSVFFLHEQDEVSVRMAAFTPEDPTDRVAFDAHWARIRRNAQVRVMTITVDGAVAGHVAAFLSDIGREVTYWIGPQYWGRGVATEGLRRFLEVEEVRPIHARVAADNVGSLRVLEKCGFEVTGTDRFFANGRGEEIDEVVLLLEDGSPHLV